MFIPQTPIGSFDTNLFLNNQDLVIVKGTSHYQDSIKPIAGSRGKSKSYIFNLKNEPNNKFDPKAILISVGNNKIGYMPKELCGYYKEITGLSDKVYCIGVITNPLNATYNSGAKIFVDNKLLRFNSYNNILLPKEMAEKKYLEYGIKSHCDEKKNEYRIKLLTHIFYGNHHTHDLTLNEIEIEIANKLKINGCSHNGYEKDLN